jgi:hypothetical protein
MAHTFIISLKKTDTIFTLTLFVCFCFYNFPHCFVLLFEVSIWLLYQSVVRYDTVTIVEN